MYDHQTGVNMKYRGAQIDVITLTHGLKLLIYQPTWILYNSLSCIGLIFTNQPNLVIDSGTHPFFTLIVTMKLFTVTLIYKLNIHHYI